MKPLRLLDALGDVVFGRKLPEEFVKLISLLLVRETLTGYGAISVFGTKGEESVSYENTSSIFEKYQKGLKCILGRLPRNVKDFNQGSFSATVRDLIRLTTDDVVLLADLLIPTNYVEHWLEQTKWEIREKEAQLYEAKQEGWETFGPTQDLKELKDELKSVKPPRESIEKLCKGKPVDECLEYIKGSIWETILNYRLSFDIPQKLRAEHCHVMAKTGGGKTQLLQQLIYEDLKTDAAIIVMTLQGEMLPTLAGLEAIDDSRLIYLSPNTPIPINIFNVGADDSDSSIELINHIFADLVDAETTRRQRTLLNHCIRLLRKTKGATLRMLYELMKQPDLPADYRGVVSQLSRSAQEFFKDSFGDKRNYGDVKEQLRWRIEGLLENSIVEQIFCQPESVLDMHQVMAEGKVLLVDTSAKRLGDEGSAFLGKFILALITIAAQQRKDHKRPVYVYIDEAGSYLTDNIATILERCRFANVGLTIAHQQLEQLGDLQSSVMTNTSTKFIGRCNENDARQLAGTLRVSHETLVHQPRLVFRFFSQDVLPLAVPITVQPGFVESQPRVSDERLEERMFSYEKHEASTHPEPPSTPGLEPDSEEPSAW